METWKGTFVLLYHIYTVYHLTYCIPSHILYYTISHVLYYTILSTKENLCFGNKRNACFHVLLIFDEIFYI